MRSALRARRRGAAGPTTGRLRHRLLEKRQRLNQELPWRGSADGRIFRALKADVLRQIDDALERMDHSAYGECENCGKAIPKARLRALPYATLCVACQEQMERELQAP